jgi:hypothetical protein
VAITDGATWRDRLAADYAVAVVEAAMIGIEKPETCWWVIAEAQANVFQIRRGK